MISAAIRNMVCFLVPRPYTLASGYGRCSYQVSRSKGQLCYSSNLFLNSSNWPSSSDSQILNSPKISSHKCIVPLCRNFLFYHSLFNNRSKVETQKKYPSCTQPIASLTMYTNITTLTAAALKITPTMLMVAQSATALATANPIPVVIIQHGLSSETVIAIVVGVAATATPIGLYAWRHCSRENGNDTEN
ncbi:hypothetical protein NA56DRAFT_747664 [Hyaloscypha hepaticicola]|uniref:Uncharacterized protein n=1 Tax=Hyaloscypha hepaticicola TaxID=2082293 RepID=A0A2J6Q9X8_9HELO|nr:hypothetical protein NA56DRAFT_747664 [Hyaloscypha hepaticicola]